MPSWNSSLILTRITAHAQERFSNCPRNKRKFSEKYEILVDCRGKAMHLAMDEPPDRSRKVQGEA
jgi:hypothetical protein